MEEVTLKIQIIEAILACPRKYPGKTKTLEERLAKLEERFPDNDSLFTYFGFSENELKNILTVLQKTKNLILAQGKGGGGGKIEA